MSKKKSGKKTATKKKAAGKKAAGKKKAGLPAKKSKGKPQPVETTPIDEAEEVRLRMPEIGIGMFPNPMKMRHAELETRTAELVKDRHQNEAELSANLWAIQERNIPQDHGYESKEYFDEVLHISPQKAAEMGKNWEMLVSMGLDAAKKLAGLSWSKLKLLRAGILAGVITRKNIDKWLEFCTVSGPKMLTHADLKKKVKDAIGKTAKDEDDHTMKTVSFKVPAYELEALNDFENLSEKVLETTDRGRAYVQAATEFMASHMNAKDARVIQATNLAKLKEVGERIAPVTCLFIAHSEEVLKQFGTPVVAGVVYQGYNKDDEASPLKMCIAISASEAKKTLKAKNLRDFPLYIGPSLMPKEQFQAPEMKNLEPPPTWLTTEKEPWAVEKDAVRDRITYLSKLLGVGSEEYKSQKAKVRAEIKSKKEDLTADQGMLRWLIAKREGRD